MMSTDSPYTLITSSIKHQNNWFYVQKDLVTRNGNVYDFFVVKKGEAVFVAPINKNLEITLVKLFRYPTNKWSLEIPAGSTDGEVLEVAAKRELQEETGFVSENLIKVGEFKVAPGMSNHTGHVFVATGLTQTGHNEQEEEGIVGTIQVSLSEIDNMIVNEEIDDGPTITSLFYIRKYLEAHAMAKKKKSNRIEILKKARAILREKAKKLKQFHLWYPRSNKMDKNKKAIENKNLCRKKVDDE
jgi:8-oxo-dGTP pyrophosphatase MutT (NUDIX family)